MTSHGDRTRLCPATRGSKPVRVGNKASTRFELVETVWEEPDSGIWEARGRAYNLALMGRSGEARQIFKHLLGVRNDVGLLGGRVRSLHRSDARELPSSLLPRGAHQHRCETCLCRVELT